MTTDVAVTINKVLASLLFCSRLFRDIRRSSFFDNFQIAMYKQHVVNTPAAAKHVKIQGDATVISELEKTFGDYLINDISKDISHTKIFLGFPSNKLQDVISVNEDLKEILSWCCRNSLLINPDKTKLLYAGVPQLMRALPATLSSATILGTEIKPLTVTKDLGVHIDCCLNFYEHITKTASDFIFKLTRVNRIKHLLDRSTLRYLLNAFVFGKLFYCSTVWRNTSNENMKKLQLVQNYACKVVTGLKKYDHITEALKSLKWLNVKKKNYSLMT